MSLDQLCHSRDFLMATHLPRRILTTMLVARPFERGPAAKSSRAEMYGDECDQYVEKMLPSSGSTEHVYESIVLLAKMFSSLFIQTLACLFQLSKREKLCYNAFVFYDTKHKFIAETEIEKTYELSNDKHHHGRC